MLVHSWTGWTRTSDADAYAEYMREVALSGYTDTPGNWGVLMLGVIYLMIAPSSQ